MTTQPCSMAAPASGWWCVRVCRNREPDSASVGMTRDLIESDEHPAIPSERDMFWWSGPTFGSQMLGQASPLIVEYWDDLSKQLRAVAAIPESFGAIHLALMALHDRLRGEDF